MVPSTKKGTYEVKNNDYWYYASESIKVYKEPGKKSVLKTIKNGEKFRVTKIMTKYSKEYQSYVAQYAYIVLDDMSSGWIYIEGHANPGEGGFMVSNYLWYC